MSILDFFNMKTLLQLLLAQKLVSSKCVLFKNNLLPSDTVPLIYYSLPGIGVVQVPCMPSSGTMLKLEGGVAKERAVTAIH